MMKMKFFAGAMLAVMAGGLVSCGGSEETLEKVQMIPVQVSKDSWSMLTPDGKVLFEDEFKNMPSAVYNDVFVTEGKEYYTVNKLNGDKYDVLGDLDELISVGYMEDGLIPATAKKQRIAVYDGSGKKKFDLGPVDKQEVTQCGQGYTEGMLWFKLENGKHGYFDKSGKVAVKATYDDVYGFSEGLAVVERYDSAESKTNYLVIDKKGDTAFKLKSGQRPESYGFDNGYLIVRDEDRTVLYDKKGETKKFPSKIKRIVATKGDFAIFSNDEGEYGVCDMEGEVIIRAKYSYIMFDGDNGFIAIKDKESLLLNKKGEEEKRYDFEEVYPFGKFGYFAKDGDRWSLIDKDGKQKGKEDFYNISESLTIGGGLRSDYFDAKAVANKMVSLIGANDVAGYKFGETPQQFYKNEQARDHTGQWTASLPDATVSGFRYDIDATAYFTESMAYSDWNYYDYSYNYYWNNDSKLYMIAMELRAQSEFGKSGYEAIVADLKKQGYSVAKEGYVESSLCAVLTKGKMAIMVSADEDGRDARMFVGQTSIENYNQMVEDVKRSITKEKNGTPDYPNGEWAKEDSSIAWDYGYANNEEIWDAAAPAEAAEVAPAW